MGKVEYGRVLYGRLGIGYGWGWGRGRVGPNCPTWARDGLSTLVMSAQCLPQ